MPSGKEDHVSKTRDERRFASVIRAMFLERETIADLPPSGVIDRATSYDRSKKPKTCYSGLMLGATLRVTSPNDGPAPRGVDVCHIRA